MAHPKIALFSPQEFQAHTALIEHIATRYRTEPEFRAEVDRDGRSALAAMGLELPEGVEIVVAANSATTTHLVMPPDPNVELGDEALSAVAGGSSVGTAGSAGTVSTFGTIPGTWSSAATAGSVGTAGSN